MKKNDILKKMAFRFAKTKFQLKEHAPELFVAAGIITFAGTVVSACVATTKLSDILDETKKQVDDCHYYGPDGDGQTTLISDYSKEDMTKDLAGIYVKTGVKVAKLYLPAIFMGAASITSFLAATKILHERNVALAAAYATVESGFRKYRDRVIDRFGDDVDRELQYGIRKEKIESETTDENGKTKKTKETIEVTEIDESSTYARYFRKGNPYWEDSTSYSLMFLRGQMTYANNRLRGDGHLFLNEVYDALGLDRSKAGQSVGWIYNPDNDIGDNYVDFGPMKEHYIESPDHPGEYERVILLDFNVDGNILNRVTFE